MRPLGLSILPSPVLIALVHWRGMSVALFIEVSKIRYLRVLVRVPCDFFFGIIFQVPVGHGCKGGGIVLKFPAFIRCGFAEVLIGEWCCDIKEYANECEVNRLGGMSCNIICNGAMLITVRIMLSCDADRDVPHMTYMCKMRKERHKPGVQW